LSRCDEALDLDRILEEINRAKRQWALGNRGVVESIVRSQGQTGRPNERGSRGQKGRI
jgi:hypothetical protein